MSLLKTYRPVLHTIAQKPCMIARFLATITVSFIALTLLNNLPFIWNILQSSLIPWIQKFSIISNFLAHPSEAFPDALGFALSFIIAFLIGINTLLIQYIALIAQKNPAHTTLIAGSVASHFLSISCIGCSQIASAVIAQLVGTGVALALLPFQQIAFSIFSILLLLILFIRLSIGIFKSSMRKNFCPLTDTVPQNQPPSILRP